tara:strand:- start:4350 stop:4934 length:585 start_codon:yes stop_codon:yes gene_type:complete
MPRKRPEKALPKELTYTQKENEFDFSILNHPLSTFTEAQKVRACMAYITTGNSIAAAKHCDVPSNVIRCWKSKAGWWLETAQKCREMKSEELDAIMTNVIHSVSNELLDRIANGDIHVDIKSGEVHRAPVAAQKLATIMGIMWDKRNLQRGEFLKEPQANAEEGLKNLMAKFEDFSDKQEEKHKNVVAVSHREN